MSSIYLGAGYLIILSVYDFCYNVWVFKFWFLSFLKIEYPVLEYQIHPLFCSQITGTCMVPAKSEAESKALDWVLKAW